MVYLCGTKYDLVEENKKARKVDVATVRDYADGELTVQYDSIVYIYHVCN